jgi:hypothetical protein
MDARTHVGEQAAAVPDDAAANKNARKFAPETTLGG